jgi:hypothetical protein
MQNQNISEINAATSFIHPAAARNTGSSVGEAIDASIYPRVLARLLIGTLAGTGTVTMKLQHCSASASSNANWADVNASCVTSTFGSGSNGKVAQLELKADQYSALQRYVRPYVEVATSNGWVGAVLCEGHPLYRPAVDFDSADVVQTVVY